MTTRILVVLARRRRRLACMLGLQPNTLATWGRRPALLTIV